MFLKNKWLVIMVWLTVLVLYGVSQIDGAVRSSSSGSQSVDFANSPIPVTVNDPASDNISVVPMGNNTVWIIDRSAGTVSVITRDKSGQFHLETTRDYTQK